MITWKIDGLVSQVTTQQVEGPLVVSVQDNGEGIPEDVRAHLFEPFITTKKQGYTTTGTGTTTPTAGSSPRKTRLACWVE